jgi:hypothetical protein
MNRQVRGILQLVAVVGVGAVVGFGVNTALARPAEPKTNVKCNPTDLYFCRDLCAPYGGACIEYGNNDWRCECLD